MFCKNQWINISWDGASVRHSKENLRVTFNQRAKTLLDFNHACDIVASEIYDSHKNLYLAFSGGSDSEHVANCLHRQGIPFTVLILNYNQATSKEQQYESWYAKAWCRRHNVTPMIVDFGDYAQTVVEKTKFIYLKPRLHGGAPTASFLHDLMNKLEGQLITGYQLEYYPDYDQMTYLEPQLGLYSGFVMQESDFYLETLQPNRHPWAFFYWNPEIMASFVHSWDIVWNMQENKSIIYQTALRPKFNYPLGFFKQDYGPRRFDQYLMRKTLSNAKWGTRDCALLGTKEDLLQQLLE